MCDGCVPPLVYEGGPVLTEAGGLTVTPIYWEPNGGQYKFPAGYEDIINGYITNVAAASGVSCAQQAWAPASSGRRWWFEVIHVDKLVSASRCESGPGSCQEAR